MTGNIESDNDDQWLEDEIQQELDQLDDSCLLSDDEQCSWENHPENCISSADTKVDSWCLYAIFHEDESKHCDFIMPSSHFTLQRRTRRDCLILSVSVM